MKTKEIASNNGLDLEAFNLWLINSSHPHKRAMFGVIDVDPTIAGRIVDEYKRHLADEDARVQREADEAKRAEEEKLAELNRIEAEKQQAAREKQQALASMLITSGFNFDGYTITKYSGYISGDDVVEVDRPTRGWLGGMSNNVGEDLMQSLVQMRRNAIAELKEAAYQLGCNAVIGVDFDYLTLDPETVTPQGGTLYLPFLFGVTANGNAVIIERKSSDR
jgi:uncharacterized protein YbjQ (UPF0145 family)